MTTDTGMTTYETNARAVADRMGLRVKIAPGRGDCPSWCENCGAHGNHYRVRLWFTGKATEHTARGSLTFDYWGSRHDAERHLEPSVYDVLACVGSDAQGPTDPDEVAEEYGPMKPSQALKCARWARRLQKFFSEAERAMLAEVQ